MPKITFGMITLNGYPFVEANLKALYPFAHQIIVVEGAVDTAAALARPDGHSQDGTLEMLRYFQQNHDPANKLTIITAQDEGYETFWPEKDEMSQAYARRATGDWLWQVDGDEFYHAADMQKVCDLLDVNSEISAVSFPYIEFWGGFDAYQRGWWYDYAHPAFHRLFKWGEGYTYATHRPPTVLNAQGQDVRELHWLDHRAMKKHEVYLYHYSYALPKQAEFKGKYYSTAKWTDAFRENQRWLEESYYGLQSPLFIGEMRKRFQWLQKFNGQHPAAVETLRQALLVGEIDEPLRDTTDIDRLMANPLYRLLTAILLPLLLGYWHFRAAIKPLTSAVRGLIMGRKS